MVQTIESIACRDKHSPGLLSLHVVDPYDFKVPFPLFVQKSGRHRLEYGSPLPSLQGKVSDTVRSQLMKLLDAELPFVSDWRDVAERLGATNEEIRFLESRKDYHESPSQHIINVFDMTMMPLTGLRDIFIELGRDDIVQMLNLEIGSRVARPMRYRCI